MKDYKLRIYVCDDYTSCTFPFVPSTSHAPSLRFWSFYGVRRAKSLFRKGLTQQPRRRSVRLDSEEAIITRGRESTIERYRIVARLLLEFMFLEKGIATKRVNAKLGTFFLLFSSLGPDPSFTNEFPFYEKFIRSSALYAKRNECEKETFLLWKFLWSESSPFFQLLRNRT